MGHHPYLAGLGVTRITIWAGPIAGSPPISAMSGPLLGHHPISAGPIAGSPAISPGPPGHHPYRQVPLLTRVSRSLTWRRSHWPPSPHHIAWSQVPGSPGGGHITTWRWSITKSCINAFTSSVKCIHWTHTTVNC